MDADEFRDTLRSYLGRELPLEVAAQRLATLEIEEGWYLYHNPNRGTPEDGPLIEALRGAVWTSLLCCGGRPTARLRRRAPPNPLMQPTNAGGAMLRPRTRLRPATRDRRFSQVVCS